MPANVLQDFKLMVSMVSLDFFQPFNYIEAGFIETSALTPQFEWVGYGSLNFLENMGSIIIFAFLQVFLILVTAITGICNFNCRCRRYL